RFGRGGRRFESARPDWMHSEVDAAQAVRGLGHGTISRRLILIAVAGLVVRLVYVFGPGRHVRGYGDYHYFHEAANLIATGHWFVDPVATLGHPVGSLPSATHPPLWTL